MSVKKDYVAAAVATIMKIEPDLERGDVEALVTQMVKEKLADPTIIMDNNVTGDNARITLTQMCNWIERENPVISGNATFYCQPSVQLSPTSNMLRNLKTGRKAVKKQMFKFKPGSDEYNMLDLDQNNKKVIMNAEYGGSGAPTAAFYTKYSPAATTLMAQSIITTMAAFFESYVGDNQKFFHINECFDWMNHVIKKTEVIPKWVVRPHWKEVAARIKKHFIHAFPPDWEFIDKYCKNCSSDELTYLYYANNVKAFIRNHKRMQELLGNVLTKLPCYEVATDEIPAEFAGKFESVDKYNRWVAKEMFMDPYTIPECIKDDMEEFITLMTQFIYVEYITPDSIIKLNNHKRNTVLLVDTDSNMINADLFVSFITGEIFNGLTFNRGSMYNDMILVNVIAASLSRSVGLILDFYGRMHHMDEASRAELTMKNEFMFRIFFLMRTKKRYAASIVLREGNIIYPFKPEIKGMDFIKAGVTDQVTKRFEKMLCDHILYSDTIELHELMTDLKNFEREIRADLQHGGVTYLKQQQYKAIDGYSKVKDENGRVIGTSAWTQQVFRGSVIWNELYPEKKINSLDRVHILKLVVTGPESLEYIKKEFPKDYDRIIAKVFMSDNPDIKKAGLKVICIPNSVKVIPRWLIPLIDYDVITSDVVASFQSVLDALEIDDIVYKTPNGNATMSSALISL